ncbi:hypothetical protein ACF09I_34490 [Streptomyces sp. NPDC014940]|uniref:hypothetical protein n=1 Tax=Streptomyces sp. NPDC014940 TaxID=3364932 RepID=UPI0036FB1909
MVRRIADGVRSVLGLLGPLGAGSSVLVTRLISRFGWKTVGGVAAVAVYAVFRYRVAIVWLLLAWCAAAWMHAPAAEAQDDVEEAGEQPPVEAPTDPFPGMVWDLIGEASGVHIKRVVEWLHETGLDEVCTAADVTAGLDRRGIPIRASVRDGHNRVNRGVHRDDLEAWFGARSPAAPVPLSKTRSDTATTAVTCDVAAAATGVATPATPTD